MSSRFANLACLVALAIAAASVANATPRVQLAQSSETDARDMAFWSSIKDSRNVEDFRSYLRAFPNGNFAALARNREAEMQPQSPSSAGTGGGSHDGQWRGTLIGCYSKQETRMAATVRNGRLHVSWVNVAQVKEEAEGTIDAAGSMRAQGLNGLALSGQMRGGQIAGTYSANALPLLGPCNATFTMQRESGPSIASEPSRDAAARPAPAASPDPERERIERERADIDRRRLELDRQKLELDRDRQEAQRLATARPVEIDQTDREMAANASANVRERPDSTAPAVGRLQRGDRLNATGKVRGANWYRVTLANGQQGFVFGELLSAAAAPPMPASPAAPAAQLVAAPAASAADLQLAVMRQEKRIALVIGNGEYRQLGKLKNPVNDARAMAAKLRALNFEIMLRENATRDQMIAAIDEFGQRLRKGGAGAFFFAGHGIQVRGNNYMMPVDSYPRSEVAVGGAAVAAAYVLDYFADAGNRFNLMMLDACRNNPLQTAFRSAQRGLAAIGRAPGGTLIAFATAPDSVAADGDGDNGIFTGELLAHIDTPGLKVEDLFKRVTTAVRQKSKGDQIPWVTGSLEGDFYFRLP